MEPNEYDPNFLDIYLEATQPGWVAVGFSKNQHMVISLSSANNIYCMLCIGSS